MSPPNCRLKFNPHCEALRGETLGWDQFMGKWVSGLMDCHNGGFVPKTSSLWHTCSIFPHDAFMAQQVALTRCQANARTMLLDFQNEELNKSLFLTNYPQCKVCSVYEDQLIFSPH
jgi:hypothetical protein